MDAATSLSRYSEAVQAVEDHRKQNEAVFSAHKALVMRVIDTENDLRDTVAETMESVSDGDNKVTVTPQTQTWADIAVIDALIASGKIPAELREQIVKTQQRPPRITISAIKK